MIRPVGQVDLPAIIDENQNMNQIVATLGLKEMTQGTLIRKLCTYTTTNPTRRAIFEFDKLRSMVPMRCRSPANFLRWWQEWCVQFEENSAIPRKISPFESNNNATEFFDPNTLPRKKCSNISTYIIIRELQ